MTIVWTRRSSSAVELPKQVPTPSTPNKPTPPPPPRPELKRSETKTVISGALSALSSWRDEVAASAIEVGDRWGDRLEARESAWDNLQAAVQALGEVVQRKNAENGPMGQLLHQVQAALTPALLTSTAKPTFATPPSRPRARPPTLAELEQASPEHDDDDDTAAEEEAEAEAEEKEEALARTASARAMRTTAARASAVEAAAGKQPAWLTHAEADMRADDPTPAGAKEVAVSLAAATTTAAQAKQAAAPPRSTSEEPDWLRGAAASLRDSLGNSAADLHLLSSVDATEAGAPAGTTPIEQPTAERREAEAARREAEELRREADELRGKLRAASVSSTSSGKPPSTPPAPQPPPPQPAAPPPPQAQGGGGTAAAAAAAARGVHERLLLVRQEAARKEAEEAAEREADRRRSEELMRYIRETEAAEEAEAARAAEIALLRMQVEAAEDHCSQLLVERDGATQTAMDLEQAAAQMRLKLSQAEARCEALQHERDVAVAARREADAALVEAQRKVAQAEAERAAHAEEAAVLAALGGGTGSVGGGGVDGAARFEARDEAAREELAALLQQRDAAQLAAQLAQDHVARLSRERDIALERREGAAARFELAQTQVGEARDELERLASVYRAERQQAAADAASLVLEVSRLQEALGTEQRLRRQAAVAHSEERDALRAEAVRLAERQRGRASSVGPRRRAARGNERAKVGIVNLAPAPAPAAAAARPNNTVQGDQLRWLEQQLDELPASRSRSPEKKDQEPGAYHYRRASDAPQPTRLGGLGSSSGGVGSSSSGGDEGLTRSMSMSAMIRRRFS